MADENVWGLQRSKIYGCFSNLSTSMDVCIGRVGMGGGVGWRGGGWVAGWGLSDRLSRSCNTYMYMTRSLVIYCCQSFIYLICHCHRYSVYDLYGMMNITSQMLRKGIGRHRHRHTDTRYRDLQTGNETKVLPDVHMDQDMMVGII